MQFSERGSLEDGLFGLEAVKLGVDSKRRGVGMTRGRFRRLHYAGACWRLPGVHFLNWEDLGSEEPDLSRIDARCSQCFPAHKPGLR